MHTWLIWISLSLTVVTSAHLCDLASFQLALQVDGDLLHFRFCPNLSELLEARDHNNRTALLWTFEETDSDNVVDRNIYALLTLGANVEAIDVHGRNAMHLWAMRIQRNQFARQSWNEWIPTYHLLNYGTRLNQPDIYGWRPGNYLLPSTPGPYHYEDSRAKSLLSYLLRVHGAVLTWNVGMLALPQGAEMLENFFGIRYNPGVDDKDHTALRTKLKNTPSYESDSDSKSNAVPRRRCLNPARSFWKCYDIELQRQLARFGKINEEQALLEEETRIGCSASSLWTIDYDLFAPSNGDTPHEPRDCAAGRATHVAFCKRVLQSCSIDCDSLEF